MVGVFDAEDQFKRRQNPLRFGCAEKIQSASEESSRNFEKQALTGCYVFRDRLFSMNDTAKCKKTRLTIRLQRSPLRVLYVEI